MRVRFSGYFVLAFLASRLMSAATGTSPMQDAVRLNNRGVALMGQQSTELAQRDFAKALEIDPKLAQAAINNGIALYTLQRFEPALRMLERAVALNSNSAQAWYNLGLVHRAKNELPQALASFQHAAVIDPRDADSLYFEGACLAEMGQFDKAIAIFRSALAIDPFHASAEFGLARALLRTGNAAEAREDLNRFQHLTTTKIGTPISLAYGEQGRYSTASIVNEPGTVATRMIPVRLLAEPMVASNADTDWSTTGGACMIDATGSGQMDLVLMQSGQQAIRILHRSNDRGYQELDASFMGLKASGHADACAVGDYDGDGQNDLVVATDEALLLFRNLGQGKFEDLTAKAGLVANNRPTGVTFIDYDHDGDLDLFLTGSGRTSGGESNVLWRNNGNGTFTEQTSQTALSGSGKSTAAILTDFNNDRAVDIGTSGEASGPKIYINPREGPYPRQILDEAEALSPSVGITTFDFNKDGWMDIALTHEGAPGLSLWRNTAGPDRLSRRFVRVPLPLLGAQRGWGLTPVDIDNDGWIDLAAIVESNTGPQIHVFRNLGNGAFQDVSHDLGLDGVKLTAPRGLIAADFENDGATDLIVAQSGAAPILLRNVGANKNHFARIDFLGVADNKTGLGAKVEVYADGMWQKFELNGSSGFGTQGPPQILVGLGRADALQMVRILWPTGVLQDEIDLPRTETIHIKEVDRRGSSCPVLFAWDGHKYKLVTDVIGAGVVGHWFTPTRHNTPNPSEWIKVNGSQTALSDGRLSLRFIEPMEEVNYIDQLRVIAVDHPANVEVNPDERFLDDPPFASGRIVTSENARLPVGAWDGRGNDVLDKLSQRDHRFASGFAPAPYDGFANLHALILDLGELDTRLPLRLLMTGYVNYFSATSLYAASQAGIDPVSPYVEAQMPDGTWQRIPGEAGFPAGLERTIVVDLSGKLPKGAHRIRLMSNLQIYWDQVLVDQSTHAQAHATELPLAVASLHFRGYPKQIEGKSPGDLDYDYNFVSLTGPFQHQRGAYTRIGDVSALVKGIDDQYVIFGSGDEIAAEFDAAKLPPLPPDWKRDYFFYANGFVKDMDWWDASPFTVSQLPFHGMSAYPYPESEHFPADDASLSYQLKFNTRFDNGTPVLNYRFKYRHLPAQPATVEPATSVQR